MKESKKQVKKAIKTPESAWKNIKLGKFSTLRVYEYNGLRTVTVVEYPSRKVARSAAKAIRQSELSVSVVKDVSIKHR